MSLNQPDLFKPSVAECDAAIKLLSKADPEVLKEATRLSSYWNVRLPLAQKLEWDQPRGYGA